MYEVGPLSSPWPPFGAKISLKQRMVLDIQLHAFEVLLLRMFFKHIDLLLIYGYIQILMPQVFGWLPRYDSIIKLLLIHTFHRF